MEPPSRGGHGGGRRRCRPWSGKLPTCVSHIGRCPRQGERLLSAWCPLPPSGRRRTIVIWKHESLLWKYDTLYGHHVHHRGAARGGGGTTRDRHANIPSCATVTRACAHQSRARFGARGPRQIAMRAQLNLCSALENKKTNKLTHALPAPCDLVRRSLHGASASHVPVTSLPSRSQPKHGVSLR
jgi:hypothetical protein